MTPRWLVQQAVAPQGREQLLEELDRHPAALGDLSDRHRPLARPRQLGHRDDGVPGLRGDRDHRPVCSGPGRRNPAPTDARSVSFPRTGLRWPSTALEGRQPGEVRSRQRSDRGRYRGAEEELNDERRCLVIDEQPAVRLGVRGLLGDRCEVEEAEDGRDALELITTSATSTSRSSSSRRWPTAPAAAARDRRDQGAAQGAPGTRDRRPRPPAPSATRPARRSGPAPPPTSPRARRPRSSHARSTRPPTPRPSSTRPRAKTNGGQGLTRRQREILQLYRRRHVDRRRRRAARASAPRRSAPTPRACSPASRRATAPTRSRSRSATR